MKSISVLICTRKKNLNLMKCLNSIKHFTDKFKINLILIENNFQKTITKYDFDKLNFNKSVNIYYDLEKKIGIPFARNRALRVLKKTNCEFVCFFDDDCEVSKDWLDSMIKIQKVSNVDIITGPQISKSKKFFIKVLERENKHLAQVNWAATNNVFAKKKAIINSNIKFSQKLKKIGGSDQLFFLSLNKKGKKIIWNENATVAEFRDKKRENFRWFLRRNMRYGASSFIIYSELYGFVNATFICIIKSFSEFLKFLFYFSTILLNLKLNFFKSIQFLTRSIFTFIGIFGFRFNEYI